MANRTVCEQDQCAGCMACVDCCPGSAISIHDSLKAYNAVIDSDKCINCNTCHRICQQNHPARLQGPIEWKEGWASEEIRAKGSSGGFGTAIIKSFIGDHNYVAACCFREGEFVFDITNRVETIYEFTGSKYVKSNPEGVYKKVKERLVHDDRVLFIGLPCQVSSMKNFIGDKLLKNLYTIDLICHGSPSPQLLSLSMKEYGFDIKRINNIYFRQSPYFGLRTDIKKVVPNRVQDRYLMAFLKGLCYTENCYNCHYAQAQRVGDLTIGDSWGSELTEEMKNGVSLALCQTEKGIELLNMAGLTLKDVDLQTAIENNHQLKAPSVKPDGREKFFDTLKKSGNFNKAVASVYKKECFKEDLKKTLIALHIMGGG